MAAIALCSSLFAPALSSAPNQPAQSLPVLALTVASLIDGTYACRFPVIAWPPLPPVWARSLASARAVRGARPFYPAGWS